METAKELKFGEYKMRKDYIGTLEAIELGETVIFPVEARDYYSIHSAASRCKRDKKMKFLIRMNWDEGMWKSSVSSGRLWTDSPEMHAPSDDR